MKHPLRLKRIFTNVCYYFVCTKKGGTDIDIACKFQKLEKSEKKTEVYELPCFAK